MESILNKADSDTNLSGIARLLYLPTSPLDDPTDINHRRLDPSQFPRVGIAASDIEVDTDEIFYSNGDDAQWYTTEFVAEECAWSTEEEETAQGTIYREKISWSVAKNYDFRREIFDDMEGREFMVIVIDRNDNRRLLGYVSFDNLFKGMRFSKKMTTGSKRSDRNYWTLEFSLESHCQPWLVKPAIAIQTQ